MSVDSAYIMILGFHIRSNSPVHLLLLFQPLAGILLPPGSVMRFTLSLASIMPVFTNLESLSCHTFSYIPSAYEHPRWELMKSFHEITAEESCPQTDVHGSLPHPGAPSDKFSLSLTASC